MTDDVVSLRPSSDDVRLQRIVEPKGENRIRGCIVAVTTLAVCLVISVSAIALCRLNHRTGGFESPDVSSGVWNIFYSIPGWPPITNCESELRDHVCGSSTYKGNQYVE